MMRQSLRKQVAEVALRVWTPQGAEVVALKQMEPTARPLRRPGRGRASGRGLRHRLLGRRGA